MTSDLYEWIMDGYLDSDIIASVNLDRLTEEELKKCVEVLLQEVEDLQHQLRVVEAKHEEGGDLCDQLEAHGY